MSLLIIIFALIFFIPISIVKIGFARVLPLKRFRFSLPIEFKNFYIFYLCLLILYFVILSWIPVLITSSGIPVADFSKEIKLLNCAFFNDSNACKALSVSSFFTASNFIIYLILLGLSYVLGFSIGIIKGRGIIKAIENDSSNLFSIQDADLLGTWGALIGIKSKTSVTIDILTKSNNLYTGKLYDFDLKDGLIESISLKNTKRFLVSLDEVKGGDEEKYSIPGKVTYFMGSDIRNINIKEIVELRDEVTIINENFKGVNLDELVKDLDKLLKKNAAN